MRHRAFLEGKPVIPVSSTTGAGLDELRAAILESVAGVGDRDASTRVFRLPIDRAFTMKGFGSVITGTTYSGRVRVEDEVEVLPGTRRSRARAIQVHGEPRDAASAGEREDRGRGQGEGAAAWPGRKHGGQGRPLPRQRSRPLS